MLLIRELVGVSAGAPLRQVPDQQHEAERFERLAAGWLPIGAGDLLARAHTGLGHAHHALGDLALARHHFERALHLYLELDSPEADDVRTHLAALKAPAH